MTKGLKTRRMYTAKCFSTSHWTDHEVRFCHTRLLDMNMLGLLIRESNPDLVDELKIRISNGMFTSQYWTRYKGPGTGDWIWTTKQQKLTIDKKEYRKGHVIKGRIDFECMQQATNPKFIEKCGKNPIGIKVYGKKSSHFKVLKVFIRTPTAKDCHCECSETIPGLEQRDCFVVSLLAMIRSSGQYGMN